MWMEPPFEADYVTDNDDGPHTAWYSVPEVYEEQEVGGYITETNIQPAVVLEPIYMEDGVIIYIGADEGVLPRWRTVWDRIVTGTEDSVKENVEADNRKN